MNRKQWLEEMVDALGKKTSGEGRNMRDDYTMELSYELKAIRGKEKVVEADTEIARLQAIEP